MQPTISFQLFDVSQTAGLFFADRLPPADKRYGQKRDVDELIEVKPPPREPVVTPAYYGPFAEYEAKNGWKNLRRGNCYSRSQLLRKLRRKRTATSLGNLEVAVLTGF